MRTSCTVLAAVFLIWGAPALAQTTLPASSADWIVQGDQSTGTFGLHVASAGDVNGDGYDDVMIGDQSYDGALADSGRISFYRGSIGGLSTMPSWTLEGSIAGARLYRAFPAGDVNGDGFDDVVAQTGAVFSLYLGSSGGPIFAPSWSYSGTSISHGDVNGDGYADLAVFSHPNISIFHGSPAGVGSTPSTVLPLPPFTPPGFWLDASIVEDLNGDGYDDLAFAWRYCSRTCLYLIAELRVHMGSNNGIGSQAKRTINFKNEGEVVLYVASAGDADGDGFGDLALSVYGDLAAGGGPSGELRLLRGSQSGLRTRPTSVLQIRSEPAERGNVDGAGDLDGDGLNELFVPEFDFNTLSRTLLIYAGSPAGYAPGPSLTVEPEQAGDEFAIAASRAGDVNGDGLGDLIISAPRFFDGGQLVGRVYVFLGRPTF